MFKIDNNFKLETHFFQFSKKPVLLLCLFFILPAVTNFGFEKNYDIQHIYLNLVFNENEKSLTGIATIRLIPLNNNFSFFHLHAKDMEIKDIKLLNDSPLQFNADSEKIFIKLPQSFRQSDSLTIQISYFTIPTKGIFFNKNREKPPKHSGQIFSHSEPEDSRYWFPCYDKPDDKFTSELTATVPDNYFLLSNGTLVSIDHDRENQTKPNQNM